MKSHAVKHVLWLAGLAGLLWLTWDWLLSGLWALVLLAAYTPEQGGPTPPGTQFHVFPLDESSTISDVLKARISIKGKWWVDDSLLARPA